MMDYLTVRTEQSHGGAVESKTYQLHKSERECLEFATREANKDGVYVSMYRHWQDFHGTKPSALCDDLLALANKPLSEYEYRVLIVSPRGSDFYLSGVPYATSQFRDRAYVFGFIDDAKRVAEKHFPDSEFRIDCVRRTKSKKESV